MAINQQTTLFFDASVLVAGSHSEGGGSALLLAACRVGGFRAQATSAVIWESLHALEGFPRESQDRFRRWLQEIAWEFLPMPPGKVIREYAQYVDLKDVHVLAAAVEGHSQFLLTLDQRHILVAAEAVAKAGLRIVILRPGDFIRTQYLQHEAYRSLPSVRGQGSL